MIVDAHAHLVPESLLDEIRRRSDAFPSVRSVQGEDGTIAFSFAGKQPTRAVADGLRNIGQRLDWLRGAGIDRQVVGCWLDMFGYELPGAEGEAWSRMINEHLLSTAAEHPEFVPLATVPLQDGTRAAAVLVDALATGCKGVMIGTQPDAAGGVLDSPDLDPFWEAADAAQAIVYVHPVFDAGDDRVHAFGMANAVGRITDTLIALSRIIFSGHVARYPGLRLVAVTGGAALPYVLGRLRRNYDVSQQALDEHARQSQTRKRPADDYRVPQFETLKALGDPEAAIRGFFYDTLVHDPRTLRFLAEIVGTEQLLMGSDSPFPIGDDQPMGIVAAAGFSAAAQSRINGGLAAELFDLHEDVAAAN